MRGPLDIFAWSRALVTDELARLRYAASVEPGVQEASAMTFPAPRQRWVDSMVTPDDNLRSLEHPFLIVHGRDDRAIPVAHALHLLAVIPRSKLHVFGQCGHWTQIEHAAAFAALVSDFLARAD